MEIVTNVGHDFGLEVNHENGKNNLYVFGCYSEPGVATK